MQVLFHKVILTMPAGYNLYPSGNCNDFLTKLSGLSDSTLSISNAAGKTFCAVPPRPLMPILSVFCMAKNDVVDLI